MVTPCKHRNLYRFLDYVNTKVSSDTQRLIMGGTAIATQPVIDLLNTKVDEETRWTSVMRTIAKIVVGTTVGVLVRHGAIKLVRNNKNFWGKAGNELGIPTCPSKSFWKNINPSNPDDMKKLKYANTFGTVVGTVTGIVTNFVIDAPLTKMLTNYLNENVKPVCMEKFEKKETEEKDGVYA